MFNRNKISLLFEVSQDFYDLILQISEDSHVSQSDVIKRAVMLFKVVKDEIKKGHQIGILDKNNKLLTEIQGI